MASHQSRQTVLSRSETGIGRASFARQLAALTSLLLVITGMTLGLVSFDIARGIIRDEIHSRLVAVSNERRELLREYIGNQHERVALIASRTRLRFLTGEYLSGRIDHSTMAAESTRILNDALKSSPDILRIQMVDHDGRVFSETDAPLEQPEVTDGEPLEVILERVAASGESYLAPPTPWNGRLMTRVVAPVRRQQGDVMAMVVVTLDVTRLQNILAGELLTEELGRSGEVLVGRPEQDVIRLLIASQRTGRSEINANDAAEIVAAFGGDAGFDLLEYNSVPVLMHYQPLSVKFGNSMWTLVAAIDAAEAYEPLEALRYSLLAAGGGLLLLGVCVTVSVARRMTRPITELTQAVDALADGSPVEPVSAERDDEFGLLARSFNSMASRLHELTTGLEQEVAQRTEDLQRSHVELNRVKERLELVLRASVRVSVIATDEDGRVTVFNSGAEHLLGYSADEIVGKHTPVLWHDGEEIVSRAAALEAELGEPVSGFDVFVRRAITNGYDEQEWTYIRKDGERRLVLLNVTPQKEDGALVGFLGVAIDISERKRHEAELLEATRAAQAANLAKSRFLANMSHEIRTPLNAVIGLTEVLLDGDMEPHQREQLQTVMVSAESLLAIINDILDFSRIEAGRLELETVPFRIHDTVGDTLKALAVRAEEKGLELTCFVDADVPEPLAGDPGRLRQVLTNLVGNAIKFTEQGEVVVGVEVETHEPELVLRFFVRDTGIGIAPDQIDRVFQSFEQADASTTRLFGGTGLGLAISRHLVELMGGEISVVSVPGEGSTFHFTVAFDRVADDQQTYVEETVSLQNRRVLIVDDNQTNRQILAIAAEGRGMEPLVADSAEAGIRMLKELPESGQQIDIILTDVHMPDTDGFAFIESVRNLERFAEVPVVVLTSAGNADEQRRCRELGVSEWLTKPVKQAELYGAMMRSLSHRKDAKESVERTGRTGLHVTERLSGQREPSTEVPPMRILLVEDSLPNQTVVKAMLGAGNHDIEVAGNGREALEKLNQDCFDVVLMDVQMPEMDGFQATKEIRAGERASGSHQFIVAMTAHALQGDREKCLAAGMDDYVAKPVRRAELLQALVRAAQWRERPVDGEQAGSGVSTSERSSGIVSFRQLQDQLNGQVDVMRTITNSYLNESRQLIGQLPELLQKRDWSEVRRVAHNLAGTMRLFGARDAADLGGRIEEFAVHRQLDRVDDLLPQFQSAVRPVLNELRQFLKAGGQVDDDTSPVHDGASPAGAGDASAAE